jgi:hypothetical protein
VIEIDLEPAEMAEDAGTATCRELLSALQSDPGGTLPEGLNQAEGSPPWTDVWSAVEHETLAGCDVGRDYRASHPVSREHDGVRTGGHVEALGATTADGPDFLTIDQDPKRTQQVWTERSVADDLDRSRLHRVTVTDDRSAS